MKTFLYFFMAGIAIASAKDRFPFAIPGDNATPDTATDFSHLSPKPAGSNGFVKVVDGRLHTDAGRIRFWGMNMCFGANFPTHGDAEKVAAHLAKLGVNAIRFHHLDMQDAPSGIWKKGLVDGKRVFDPEMVDRFDYFLAELHKHGIYANLNLHCSRELREDEGFANHNVSWPTSFNKFVLYFEPRMKEKLKEFCREYLLHKNPYRDNKTRVEDPAVALMELTNENAFTTRGPEVAAKLPEPYRSEFVRQWNAWLKKKYADDATLLKAWNDHSVPFGESLANSGAWMKDGGRFHWNNIEPKFGLAGPVPSTGTMRIKIDKPVNNVWEQQLQAIELSLKEGQVYTMRFHYKAAAPREIPFEVSMQHPLPWEDLGGSGSVNATTEWQKYEHVFTATKTADKQARLCFNFGGSTHDVWLAGLNLIEGGSQPAIVGDGTLAKGNIDIPLPEQWGKDAVDDVLQFMAETEISFTNEMLAFLRDDLGVRIPISSTQVNYHGWKIAAQTTSDFADVHAYWHHPLFPRKQWDKDDWTIQNRAIEANPLTNNWPECSMLMRCAWRFLDKPFTFSEWNSGEPMHYGASLVSTAAIIGGLQDFDAVFFFQYDEGNSDMFRDHMRGFFSMNSQPAKLAMFSACANLFRRGDLAPLTQRAPGTDKEQTHGGYALTHRIGVDPNRTEPPIPYKENTDHPLLKSPNENVIWDASNPDTAHVKVDTPKTKLLSGFIGEKTFNFDDLALTVGQCTANYACIVITSLDNLPIAQSKRILVTSVASAENTNMQWNADKTSVGSNWGHGPTTLNNIPISLTGAAVAGTKAFRLDGTGKRLNSISLEKLSKSAFYELIRE
jgi:hypothetical protein